MMENKLKNCFEEIITHTHTQIINEASFFILKHNNSVSHSFYFPSFFNLNFIFVFSISFLDFL